MTRCARLLGAALAVALVAGCGSGAAGVAAQLGDQGRRVQWSDDLGASWREAER